MTEIPSILAEHYPFCEHLKADEQHAFVSCSMIRGYEKGSFVRSDCDECLGVLLVLSGELRIYIQSDEGREVTLFRVGPGELCTLSASCVMSARSHFALRHASFMPTRPMVLKWCSRFGR